MRECGNKARGEFSESECIRDNSFCNTSIGLETRYKYNPKPARFCQSAAPNAPMPHLYVTHTSSNRLDTPIARVLSRTHMFVLRYARQKPLPTSLSAPWLYEYEPFALPVGDTFDCVTSDSTRVSLRAFAAAIASA